MSVDGLSDSELRSKLMEYGYPVGPVTHTTRKILVKKLKNLIETRGGTWSLHSLAARYSSEDTDDDTSSTASKKKKPSGSTRRQTLANPMPPPPPAQPAMPSDRRLSKSPVKEKPSEFKDPIAPDFVATSAPFVGRTHVKTTKKYSKKSVGVSDGLETGSDSDIVDEVNRTYTDMKYDSKYTKPRSVHTMKDNKYVKIGLNTNISTVIPPEEDTYPQDNTNQRDLLANYETPFLSEFTKRLSSQSNLPSPSSSGLKNPSMRYSTSNVPELKEKDSNGHFSSLKTLYSGPSSRYGASSIDRPRETLSRNFKPPATSREDARNNQNMVSVILVAVLALFFGVLAVIYMGLGGKADTFPSLSTDSNIPLCFLGADLKTPGVNCLMKENVESVLQLLKRLQPILLRKAVTAICENSGEIPYLTDSDIMQIFTNSKVTSLEVKEDLLGAQFLVIKNPQWGISLIDVSDDNSGADYEVLDSLTKLFSTRLNGKVGMINLNPDLPMQCHVKNKLFTIFSSLLIVSLGLLAAIGMQKLFVWYIRYKKCTEREVFKLVSEIINMVETHHQNAGLGSPGGTQETFLAINHVRDNLIPPIDRKKMSGLWEKAVKFLDENESRIRREVQQVAGEEFHVWRWLPNNVNKSNAPSPSVSKKSKVWQGQAFETMEGSVNSLTCSPTPCLKIRHMFDPDVEFEDNWETKVQDAILEKCGEGVKILHIRVDRGSREGCVYMKCLSQEDAGKAYRALHGCWFDGHLVTVKYLRLERYHERFPDAIRCTAPLKPSNNQRLSMQAHYWQSPLEAN